MNRLPRRSLTTLVALATLALGACKGPPRVRPHQWTDEQAALQTLAARADSIRSIQGPCTLTLTDTRGETVTFDGALVVRLDGDHAWLRLRTWKLGHAVFDTTVRPDGVWLLTSDEASQRMPTANDTLKAARPDQIAEAIRLMTGDFFRDPAAKVVSQGQSLTVTRPLDHASITATIDRATLTVTQYTILDDKGTPRQTLHLSDYREIGPDATPFPLRIKAVGNEGSAEVRMDDLELNGTIDDAAFTPPRRAVKQ